MAGKWEVFDRRKRRQSRLEIPVGDGSESWHGTYSGYSYHRCGCERCLTEGRRYQREWKANRPSAS